MPGGEGDCLEPSMDLEFREDVLHVGSHCVLAHRQPPGDLGSSGAFAEELEDVSLSPRQLSEQELGFGVLCPRRQGRLVGHHYLPVDHGLDRLNELGQRNILGYVARESQADCLADRTGVVQGGHGHDLGRRKLGEDPFAQHQPVHVRKSQIDEDELRTFGDRCRQGLGTRTSDREDNQPKVLQSDANHIGEEPVVIDDQDRNSLAPPPDPEASVGSSMVNVVHPAPDLTHIVP